MEYALTEEDIAKLGLLDAMPGEPATAAEMQSLGVSEQQPVVVAAPAAQQTQQQDEFAYLTDPFSTLTKTQRRMLAFSAIQDAGMAMLGQQGNSFNSLMSDFTARADAARKAKAVQAQQAAAAQQAAVMGGVVAGMGGNMTREQINAAKMTIMQGLASGAIDATSGNAILSQLDQRLVDISSQVEGARQAAQTVDILGELRSLVKEKPEVTGQASDYVSAVLSSSSARRARDLQMTLESNMALDALRALKTKSGATLGQVSEKELELLKADIQKINLAQSAEDVMSVLDRIERNYMGIIKQAYEEAADPALIANAVDPQFLERALSLGSGATAPTGGGASGTTSGGLEWRVD